MDNLLNKISLKYQLNKISHLIFHYNWSSANSILKTYIFLAEVAIVGPVEHSEPCNLTTETNSSHLQISTGMTTFKLCSRLLHPNVSEFKQATINNHISVKPFFLPRPLHSLWMSIYQQNISILREAWNWFC